MNQYQVTETAVVDAPAARVYDLIADYHVGHPSILPSRYFKTLTVTAGGQGAGTAVTVEMNVLGTKTVYHIVVTEPEPGHILMEEDSEAGIVTTFTVDSVNGGGQTRVTIQTTAPTASGLKGALEKWVTATMTRKIYREELGKLAQVIQA